LWRKLNPGRAARIAEEALPVAEELGLNLRAMQLKRLIPSHRKVRCLD
jgi:hypothetical protein